MPPKNDFSQQRDDFTKNLGLLNDTITNANTKLKSQISTQTNLMNKSGMMNIKAMRDHAKELHIATNKLKSGTIQKEVELKSDKLEKTVKGLSDATYKLDSSSKKFQASAKELSASNKKLSSSMDDIVDVTNKNMEQLKYLGDHMKKFGKWAAIGGAAGAGYLGYKAIRGVGRTGARVATAPIRAGVGLGKAYLDIPEAAATEVLGNVRTDLWSQYKKALGTGLAAAGGGLVPGMFLESATANLFGGNGGGGGAGGPGMMSRMATGAGGLARKGFGGLQIGVNNLADFVSGFPRETREKGIFRMMPVEDEDFVVSPSEEFKENLGVLSDEKIQSKIMTKSLTSALEDSGRTGLFKRMFTGVFKIGSTIAYALPMFGAGYRAELPDAKRYGMFGAMLQTLGMLYVHTRFASEESNKLALQQARLLQIGFEIPGTLWKPGPRSLSEWIGKSIGDTLSGETGPLTFMKDVITGKAKGLFSNLLGLGKEKGMGLLGMIPGYRDWVTAKGRKKESDELRASPSLARRLLLMTDIRDTLIEMRDIMLNRGGSAMSKPISLQKASTHPHVITKTGTAELHAGETVGSSRGGLFSGLFGGIASLFSGGIFKRLKDWITGLFKPMTSKLDELLNWFKATFSFLTPAVEAMHEIQTAFGVGMGSRVTGLAGGGGVMLEKRGKKSIFGGIFNVIRELPIIVEKSLTNIAGNIKEIFNREIGERSGIQSIIIKAYQTLIPTIFKEAGGKIFESIKGILTVSFQSVADMSRHMDRIFYILSNYGEKIIKPFEVAWNRGESPFTKILGVISAIPASTWEAIKGLIPLGKDLYNAVNRLLSSTKALEDAHRNISQFSAIDIPTIISDLRKNIVERILPDSWNKIFATISDRLLEWSSVSFNSFYNAFDAMDAAAKDFTEARIKRPGIPGVVSGIFQYMFRIVKAAFDPLGTAITNTFHDIVWLGKGIKKYSLSKFVDDIAELGKKIRILSSDIQNSITEFAAFVGGSGKSKAMRKGGLIFAAQGIVVGEAGPEAVLPLSDPRATARISGMFSEALSNLGYGRVSGFEDQVINRLDSIIGILGGHPGTRTKKSKIISGTMGIFGKLIHGITDIGVTLAKLPFQIGSDVARGIAKGLSKSIGMLADIGHTMLSAMRTGFTALRHTIDIGVSTIKMTLSTMWSAITAPFKAIGRFIMKPFQSIRDKYLKFKEGLKGKIKGVIQWLKPGGKTAPIGVDQDGKYIYAKWPAEMVKYTKGIYKILLKQFGFGLPGFDIGNKIQMMKTMIPQLLPMITPYIFGAIGVAGVAAAMWDSFKGVSKARSWHGVAEGQKVSLSQKVTSGIGGFLGGTGEGLAGRTAWGVAKGAAIGAGVGSVVPVVGTAIGAAVGSIAGGILGAIGGKNIAKGLQFVWSGVKKIATSIWSFIMWPFKLILGISQKFRAWFGEKIGAIPFIGKWYKEQELSGAPMLAKGGLITSPTPAFLGESGPEVVIPLNKAPAFARMINDIIMTSPKAIAEHEAMLEHARQRAGADRLLAGNKKLQEALSARHPINNNVVTNQVTNSNSLNTAISTNGVQQKLDEETERILGGRLN